MKIKVIARLLERCSLNYKKCDFRNLRVSRLLVNNAFIFHEGISICEKIFLLHSIERIAAAKEAKWTPGLKGVAAIMTKVDYPRCVSDKEWNFCKLIQKVLLLANHLGLKRTDRRRSINAIL